MRVFLTFFVLLAAVMPFSAVAQESWNLLGTVEFPLRDISSIPKWKTILQRIRQEENIYAACDRNRGACNTSALREWRDFIDEVRGLPTKKKLERVNRFANKWPYKTDNRVWGMSDYWATPMEFMTRSGDCEDYSIFKYVTLKAVGIPAEHIRLVVVKDTVRNLAHAILAVWTPEEVYILDSLFDTPLPHRQVLQYSPYYSVTETTRYTHAQPMGNTSNRNSGRSNRNSGTTTRRSINFGSNMPATRSAPRPINNW